MARNTIVTAINPLYPLTVMTRPTPVQQKAFDLLGARGVASSGRRKQDFLQCYQRFMYQPKKEDGFKNSHGWSITADIHTR